MSLQLQKASDRNTQHRRPNRCRCCTYHVQIALWDAPESQWCSDLAKYKSSVVRLFGIYADFPNGNLALTASSSFRVADAGGSEKAKRLQQASADLLTGDAVTLPAAATRSAGASRSTEH